MLSFCFHHTLTHTPSHQLGANWSSSVPEGFDLLIMAVFYLCVSERLAGFDLGLFYVGRVCIYVWPQTAALLYLSGLYRPPYVF